MTASGQVTNGHWAALLIGVVMLLILVAPTTAAIMRGYRARRRESASDDRMSDLQISAAGPSLWRCQALIAEALVVRQRLSGQIDAETYQIRMNDLARQATSERHSQRNAQ